MTDLMSLSDCLCFLRYWVICVLKIFFYQFMTSYILPTKPFFYMNKKSGQKFKYLEDETTLKLKQKAVFLNFKGLSVARDII